MEKNYQTLPDGPVICETCALSGRNVEMQRHPKSASYDDKLPVSDDAGLQSYRCPDCENVSVFRVT